MLGAMVLSGMWSTIHKGLPKTQQPTKEANDVGLILWGLDLIYVERVD